MRVDFSISTFHADYFLCDLTARIKLAAAISLGLYFKSDSSNSEISCIYYAKKKV